jgi:hypothetical protein
MTFTRQSRCHHLLSISSNHAIVTSDDLALFASYFTDRANKILVMKLVLLLDRSETRNTLYIETIKKVSSPRKFIHRSIEKYNVFTNRHGIANLSVVEEASLFSLSSSKLSQTAFSLKSNSPTLATRLIWENEPVSSATSSSLKRMPRQNQKSKCIKMQSEIDKLNQVIADLRAKMDTVAK